MKAKFILILKSVANFLRLVDENGQLSLTNVAVLVVLVKLALTQNASLVDAGALFVSLLNYSGKKVLAAINAPDPKATLPEQHYEEVASKIKDIQATVSSMSIALGFRKKP
jgi:hypothetical protein